MTAQELTIWSMTLGAIALLTVARLAPYLTHPSSPQFQAIGYHTAVFALVLILSGVLLHLWPDIDATALRVAQVLAGPCCVALSDLWIRGWLYAPQRDRVMSVVLGSSAMLLPAIAAACLLLPTPMQLAAAAALSLLGGALTLWLTSRAWLLGDRLAALMAVGCLLTVPAIGGLYAIAMHWPGLDPALQAVFALCAAASNAITGVGLWRREQHERRARSHPASTSTIDPVTRLRSGRSLVHRIMQAQRRRNRSGRDGAVLAVLLFDIERLRADAGTTGLNEVYIGIASRIRRQLGTVNVVGRYYEGCFVALVDSLPSVSWLRTVALRLASGLRRPLVITLRSGDRVEITPDVSVGVVHLSRPAAPVEDVLAEAQRMAMAARETRFRVAVRDIRTGQPIAIEDAQFGARARGARLLRTVA